MNQNPERPDMIFEVEIGRNDSLGNHAFTTIELPATTHEILDALEKARVTDKSVAYSIEIIDCELEYLPQFINPDTDIFELNHLAHRLGVFSEWNLDCFEGLVMMDAIKTGYAPIAMERLINMTHSVNDCQVAYEADDDETLGKFYADNDFIEELATLPEKVFPWLDYSKIGKERRESENGVFTPNGYVVLLGELLQTYKSGDAIPTEKPDYTILVEVTKGFFNDPEYDNNLSALLKLPADDNALCRAVDAVQAASPEECGLQAIDCIVPRLTAVITDELDSTDGDCYGLVSELSGQLGALERSGKIPVYKAMLDTAPQNITLENALELASWTENFTLTPSVKTLADYARIAISKFPIPSADELFTEDKLTDYGAKLLDQDTSSFTAYGLLTPVDGQTVQDIIRRPDQGMEWGEQK